MKAVISTALAAGLVTILLVVPQVSLGQGKQIPSQTAGPGTTQDFSRARWMPPLSTVAALPTASTVPNRVYIVTNGASETDCTMGGGTDHVWCQAISSTWTAVGGGGGGGGSCPGGSDTQVQYNDMSACGGDSGLTFNESTDVLSVTGGVATGSSPPSFTAGTGGVMGLKEGTASTAVAASDICYADSTAHNVQCSYDNGAFFALARVIASGTKALATSAINTETCSSAQTDTATGAATSDTMIVTFASDPTGITGYIPLVAGGLTIYPYVTANTANFKICNFTSGSITPGALSLNWRVVR